MHQQPVVIQSNSGKQPATASQASVQVLVELIHDQVGKLILSTAEVAHLLGKTEQALRLAEARHRSRFGCELLPAPLMKNGSGRIWTVLHIAAWMASCGALASPLFPAVPPEPPRRGPGRPRRAA
jgi:hypothetical protein